MARRAMSVTRWAAVVSAAAAVVVAVVTVLTFFRPVGTSAPQPVTSTPQTPASPGESHAPAVPILPPDATASPTTGPASVRWRGLLTIRFPNGTALDPVPPHEAHSIAEADVDVDATQQNSLTGGGIGVTNTALWTSSAAPTRQECSDQIDTNPQVHLPVRSGSVVCVRTAAGRIATLSVVQFSSDNYGSCRVNATVWE
jgi:hypothetical protein